MGRKRREKLEFRFYEIPQGESALALLGDDWVGTYGHDDVCMHFHNLFEVGYCRYGYGLLAFGEKEYVYENDMLSVIPAHYTHITLSEGEDAWEYLFLDPAALIRELFPNNPRLQAEKLALINKGAGLYRAEEQPGLASVVCSILEEMRARRPYYQEAVRHLVKLFLLELLRLREQREDEPSTPACSDMAPLIQILPALNYMEEHYADSIKAAELAQRCGLSEAHFRRVFEARVSMPPMDYLNLIRIRNACRLMQKRDCPMDMVAVECGFPTTSTFTRNFKKFMDITPYQWKLSESNYESQLLNFEIIATKGRETL